MNTLSGADPNDSRGKRRRLGWASLAALGLVTIAAVGLSSQAGAAPTALPSVSVSDATVTEGNSGTAVMTFTVDVSPGAVLGSRVQYATADGSATTANGDYVATSGTLVFTTGSTSQTVDVTVNGDTTVEPDEAFTLNLSGAVDLTIADGIGTGTIVNDDVPGISIGDATVTEGNAGPTTASFPVTLSAPSFQNVTVGFATTNGTATAGSDYAAASGTATFAPGTTSQTIDVTVNGDTTVEPDETFSVDLSGASGATIVDGSAMGTIVNDDLASLSIGDASVTEGDTGTTTASFPVTLSAPSFQNVTVDFATANGTATAPSDYAAASGTLTFSPGQVSKTISVSVNGDTLSEPTELYSVNLSGASGATIADGSATGTIVNDDPQTGPDVSIVKTTTTPTIDVGGTARFSIAVANNGPGPASGVLVTDTLPAGLQLTSISASQGSCSGSSCSIGSIAQGASASVSVTARATAVGKAVNTASVSQSLPDPVPANGTSSATVDVVSNAPPPPPPPAPLPAPTSTEVNVAPSSGDGQCVALKGGGGCKPLDAGQHVDIADIAYVDPGTGKVQIQSVVGVGNFYGGKFSLKQLNNPGARTTSGRAAAKPILVVNLVGNFKRCSTKSRSVSSAAASKPVRRLWGKGKGRFRTKGRYASGTVRGTNWLTEDYCNGTQIRVVSGIVQVEDLVLKKLILVHPGEKYFAKAPKTKTTK